MSDKHTRQLIRAVAAVLASITPERMEVCRGNRINYPGSGSSHWISHARICELADDHAAIEKDETP